MVKDVMKISEIIEELEYLRSRHGDLDMTLIDNGGTERWSFTLEFDNPNVRSTN